MAFKTRDLMVNVLAFGAGGEKKPGCAKPSGPAPQCPNPSCGQFSVTHPQCPNPSCNGASVTREPGKSSAGLDLEMLKLQLREALHGPGTV